VVRHPVTRIRPARTDPEEDRQISRGERWDQRPQVLDSDPASAHATMRG
jgi:hypothetical protein